jgi:tetratricopeptide (TPR) repeat protein
MSLRNHLSGPFFSLLLFLLQGCASNPNAQPSQPLSESSGNEEAFSAPTVEEEALRFEQDLNEKNGLNSDSLEKNQEAASPWGATRAEECQPPARLKLSQQEQEIIQKGVKAIRENNLEQAEKLLSKVLSKNQQAYLAAYNLGVIAQRKGQRSLALDYYEKAMDAQGDYEKAIRAIINEKLRLAKKDEALALIGQKANQYPTNLYVQAIYAEVLAKMRRFDEAWERARQALRCNERFIPALVALVKASLAQGRIELATSILDQALEIDEQVAELHFMKSQLLSKEEGRLREVLDSLKKAVEIEPNFAEAQTNLGIQLLSAGNVSEALTHFEKALAVIPNIAETHLNMGDAYRASKQWEKAFEELERARSLDGSMAEVHYNLALLYMDARDEFPGLDDLTSLQKALEEFNNYRSQMGARLMRNDPSTEHIERLERMINRIERRREREAARAARAAEEPEEFFEEELFEGDESNEEELLEGDELNEEEILEMNEEGLEEITPEDFEGVDDETMD